NTLPSTTALKPLSGQVNVNGFNQSITSLSSPAAGGNIVNLGGDTTLTLNIPNIGANAAYSGSITSNISLVINSTPGTTQQFNQANTYIGTTTINSGNLYCNADNVI